MKRIVYIISDGTGLTAESLANSLINKSKEKRCQEKIIYRQMQKQLYIEYIQRTFIKYKYNN